MPAGARAMGVAARAPASGRSLRPRTGSPSLSYAIWLRSRRFPDLVRALSHLLLADQADQESALSPAIRPPMPAARPWRPGPQARPAVRHRRSRRWTARPAAGAAATPGSGPGL